MLGIDNLWLFISAGLLLNITPGPDMLYVASRSTMQGPRAGMVSALGIGAGSLVHMAAAAFGVSAILMYSAVAYEAVKWAGAMYLIYLGLKAIIIGSGGTVAQHLQDVPLFKVFREAAIVNLFNPKVALFFLSFLPQFTNPAAGNITVQILFLGLIFNLGGVVVNILVGIFMGSAGSWILRNPRIRRIQTWVTGSVFIGLGVHLALSERR